MLLLVCAASTGATDLKMGSLFQNHMVLQRAMPVPVWGSSAPGTKITIAFAGQTKSSIAGKDGKWMVKFDPMPASCEGRTMKITSSTTDAQPLTLTDVLVGEVWICSGQSNMQYGWGKESLPMYNWGGDPVLAALAEDARKKPIRNFSVPTNVSFTPNEECKGKWSTDISGSAVAFGFSYYLQKALDVPVAVIVSCWGSSSIEGWMPLDMTQQLPHYKKMMDDFQASDKAKSRVSAAMKKGIRHGMVFVRKQPNLLYNAMLHPVIPYACRGMVWYQGEANAGKPEEYARSLPLWTKRLRKGWGSDDFHLLVVMLPGYGAVDGRPDAKSWALFRDTQMQILKLPHTSVANTIDLGDPKNIHPADKAPLCERLALLACRDVNGLKVVAQGPTYKDFSVKGNAAVISFSHAQGFKTTDGKLPTGFWLADADQQWYPATAAIDGNSVILKADGLSKPVACRYAFTGKPTVNLVNGAKLPAYPFRSDDWQK